MRKTMVVVFVLLLLSISFAESTSTPERFDLDYKYIFDNHQSMMLLIRKSDGRIMMANQAALDFYEYTLDELLTMNIGNLNTMSNEQIQAAMNQASRLAQNYFEFDHMTKSGLIKHVRVSSYSFFINGEEYLYSIIHDATATVASLRKSQQVSMVLQTVTTALATLFGILLIFIWRVSSARKVTLSQLKKEEDHKQKILKEMAYQNYHDPLTGLYNRRFFEEELKRFNVDRNLPISIIQVDLDGLKMTNDAFGHETGDQLIIAAAKVLQDKCRAYDVLSRWGGDEFVIILPKTSQEQVQQVIDRINEATSHVKVGHVQLSFSLGAATKSEYYHDIIEVLKEAEDAMYQEKLSKGNLRKKEIIEKIKSELSDVFPPSAEHMASTANLCKGFGTFLDLNPTEVDHLYMLGLNHDIGFIGLDDYLLNSGKAYHATEYKEMQKHTEVGYRLLVAQPDLADLADEVLYHHENFNGTGYPKRLKGEEIPYFARILRICDSYDMMVRGILDGASLSHAKAIEELKRHSGTMYDPDLNSAFIEWIETA